VKKLGTYLPKPNFQAFYSLDFFTMLQTLSALAGSEFADFTGHACHEYLRACAQSAA